jgi:hypothetical protein
MNGEQILTISAVVFAILLLLPAAGACFIYASRAASRGWRRLLCRLNRFELLEDDGSPVQHGLYDCGEAGARTALQLLSRRWEQPDSRQLASMAGTSMLDLKRYLSSEGLAAEGLSVPSGEDLQRILSNRTCAIVSFPFTYLMRPRNPLLFPFFFVLLIASLGRLYRTRHWVVVHRAPSPDGFVVRDSFVGTFRVGRARFEELWNRTILLVRAPDPGAASWS